ncbi:MAG: DNA primase [Actinomycetota bacterium]|nr:DNA primase [Actinomycetota bacterium]MDA2971151.1 DNA primase [Actinomycetota bacterium]MDA3000902.1 DNA primase [Actinomycetota bacterium]
MGIHDEDIERVRSSVSIVDVVQQYVTLRRTGRNWVGLCPFHAEKSGSFNVREETGRYKCFGCQAGGDVFTFVQEIDHVDFVSAVEKLAGRAGITLRYTSGGEGKDRQRRKQLVGALEAAVEWYHQQLLTAPGARPARDYLRERGLAGDVARQFRLGWAPDEWDALSGHLRKEGFAEDVLRDTGLAFTNRANRLQDAFRARVMFPIFTDGGEAVAFGGRILPGSTDPAKYKNSPETKVYQKSKTLYGLNWAKSDVVKLDQVIVCEGYTDVIGFHRAGVPRAVATCGTAFTEEHVRVLKRFASKVVLAFDADAAGQGAAEKFYEWERKYKVEVSVARFPDGKDPGDLASSDPDALSAAVQDAMPFLGFRVNRVVSQASLRSPEDRARVATRALEVINEHPDVNVRKLYAGEVAARVGIPVADLSRQAEKRRIVETSHDEVVPVVDVVPEFTAEFAAVALLLQSWDSIAPWLVEELFANDVARRAFLALAEASEASDGTLVDNAMSLADPEVRELLERAAVADIDVEPSSVAFDLISVAVRRVLSTRTRVTDVDEIRADGEARRHLEDLGAERTAQGAGTVLLGWLVERSSTSASLD